MSHVIKVWGSIDDGEPELIAVAEVSGPVSEPDVVFAVVLQESARQYEMQAEAEDGAPNVIKSFEAMLGGEAPDGGA